MRIVSAILGAALIVVALTVFAAATVVVVAAPYLLAAALVWAVIRAAARRQRPVRAPCAPGPRRAPSPQTAGTGRWVLVPVWLAPEENPRLLPVLDAEMLDDGPPR